MTVYKLDRFSRDKYESTIHKHTLKENGVKLVSAMENIPDSPEGIILESLLEGMNQYFSEDCFYGHNISLRKLPQALMLQILNRNDAIIPFQRYKVIV